MAMTRTSILAALGLTAAAAVAAVIPTAAGAIDQDLVVTPTSGPPGTVITVSSASCTAPGDGESYLEVSLITGTAPNEQLAAIGQSFDSDSTTLTVPDWVDPDQPAVLEASCSTYDPESDTGDDLDYDPVPFDVEPGSGTPVQVRTLSRTELLAGQGFVVTGSCGTGFDDGAVVASVFEGTDQSGRNFGNYVGEGIAQPEADGAFEVPVIVSNAQVGFEISGSEGAIESINAYEEAMDVPDGDYTVMTFCSDDSDSILFLEPAGLTVTGSAPTDLSDLEAVDGTRQVTFSGECDAEVTGWLDGISADDLVGDFDASADAGAKTRGASRYAQLLDGPSTAGRIQAGPGQHLRTPSGRAVGGSELGVDFTATPDSDGIWTYSDEAAFDEGIIAGQAVCGDPFADGFAYDPQGVGIQVEEDTTTTTTTTTVPAPAPANAVAGTPTYAG